MSAPRDPEEPDAPDTPAGLDPDDRAASTPPAAPAGGAATPPGLRPATALFAVLVVIAAAYAPSLDGPFLWDDLQLVTQPMTERLHAPWEYLVTPFWDLRSEVAGSGMFYRPLTVLSLALDRALHGENAVGFHLTNVALHLVNVALVFALARRAGAGARGAGAGALLWGLAPRLAESVAWISGRTDTLCATFGLGAVLAWSPRHPGRRALALLLALAALLAKEAGLAALAAIAVAEGSTWLAAPRRRAGDALVRVGLAGVTLAIYLALRAQALPGAVVASAHGVALTTAERALTVLEAAGRYVWLALLPWFPQTQIGVVGSPAVAFSALGGVALALAAWKLPPLVRRANAEERAVLALGGVSLALVLHVIPLAWSATVGDRLLYIPLATLTVYGARWLDARTARGWRGPALLAAVGLSFLPALERRIGLFADEVAFWVDAVETTAPESCGPESALVDLLQRARMCAEADEVLDLSEARGPFVRTCGFTALRAHCASWRGDYDTARALYVESANRRTVTTATDVLEVARAALRLGELAEARRLQRQALRISPEFPDALAFGELLDRIATLAAAGSQAPAAAAELEMLSGRRLQAERAWLAALRSGALDEEAEDRALAFLFRLGSATGAAEAADLVRLRRGQDSPLLPALVQRQRTAEQLREAMPRIRDALGAKRDRRRR
ncbi:MAG: tetratricopeptide repeat protein [Polyangiaceae bacterium]|nr:tetratricopeptide repeat protein [Polyangiaceae bacterium]